MWSNVHVNRGLLLLEKYIRGLRVFEKGVLEGDIWAEGGRVDKKMEKIT